MTPGQVYLDVLRGVRVVVVEVMRHGIAGDDAGPHALVRRPDGHPGGTGVLSAERLAGDGYRIEGA